MIDQRWSDEEASVGRTITCVTHDRRPFGTRSREVSAHAIARLCVDHGAHFGIIMAARVRNLDA
jgi:hypothetical protein